jgi:hypothetical protein
MTKKYRGDEERGMKSRDRSLIFRGESKYTKDVTYLMSMVPVLSIFLL